MSFSLEFLSLEYPESLLKLFISLVQFCQWDINSFGDHVLVSNVPRSSTVGYFIIFRISSIKTNMLEKKSRQNFPFSPICENFSRNLKNCIKVYLTYFMNKLIFKKSSCSSYNLKKKVFPFKEYTSFLWKT